MKVRVLTVLVGLVVVLAVSGTAAAGGIIASCDQNGNSKDKFYPGEGVYIGGSFISDPDSDGVGDIYVVKNKVWNDGDNITDVVLTKTNVPITDVDGQIYFLANVGDNPGDIPYPGEYDVIYDLNRNGKYDDGEDPIDNSLCAGLETVPEFTTIAIPAALALLVGLFVLRRR